MNLADVCMTMSIAVRPVHPGALRRVFDFSAPPASPSRCSRDSARRRFAARDAARRHSRLLSAPVGRLAERALPRSLHRNFRHDASHAFAI
ncbi:hypothetical protein [Burkholderia gladioli]|uniref:hypothetical protein n=1 Tax=Burkholderia gladioli TaxID=28095 RepID=UPI0011B28400|nr:hypothetical protein [Burkholderia gladioli]